LFFAFLNQICNGNSSTVLGEKLFSDSNLFIIGLLVKVVGNFLEKKRIVAAVCGGFC